MKKKIILVTIILCAIIILIGCTEQEGGKSKPEIEKVKVEAPCGPVQGVRGHGISSYKGIPFAKVTTRFAPAKDMKKWTETLDCEEYGPTAMQEKPIEGIEMSEEDCLNLNVWTPAKSPDDKLPVYVWIHGGAFANGSGSKASYDGTNFAKDDIIVITVNYRMGALGYFASRETYDLYKTTGNWGTLDQIKALEWVQKNVSAFGGDPDNVTVGGESAGSYSVSALISSPLAKGLFKNAIMESGSMLGLPGNNQYAKGDLGRSIEVSDRMSYTFGAKDNAAGLSKLRRADADVLTQMTPVEADFTKLPAYLLTPVYDGYVMPKDLPGSIDQGKVNKVNLLWGYNKDEGSIFVPDETSRQRYKMLATKMYGTKDGQVVLDRFPVDKNNTAAQRARQILAYGMFNAVMKPYGDVLADSGKKVYGYQFDYTTEKNEKKGLGAHHGSEIAYAFGNLPKDTDRDQKALSDEVQSRFVNFIKTENPNDGDLPSDTKWPKYDSENCEMMIFNEKIVPGEMTDRENIEFMYDLMKQGEFFN